MIIFLDLKDIIFLVILAAIIVISIIYTIIRTILDIGKKNCYECKYYKLDDVASCGDCCWYRCIKHNRKDNATSMNTREHLERCKDFKVK